jgi:hypothetical protein
MADRALEDAETLLGKIVIVGRGSVPFAEKARRVAAAGGVGMVVLNSSDELFICTGTAEDVRMPVVCVGQADGSRLVDGVRVSLHGVRNERGILCFTEKVNALSSGKVLGDDEKLEPWVEAGDGGDGGRRGKEQPQQIASDRRSGDNSDPRH